MKSLPVAIRPAVLLAAWLAASAALTEYTGYHPYLLLRWRNFWGGICAGAVIAAAIGILHLALLIVRPKTFGAGARERAEVWKRRSPVLILASAIAAGAGEECFLRAHVFGWLMEDRFWLGLGVVSLLQLAVRAASGRRFLILIPDVVEGAAFAMLFYAQHSVFQLAVARVVQYEIVAMVMRTPAMARWLEQGRYTWRSIYGLTAHAPSHTTLRV